METTKSRCSCTRYRSKLAATLLTCKPADTRTDCRGLEEVVHGAPSTWGKSSTYAGTCLWLFNFPRDLRIQRSPWKTCRSISDSDQRMGFLKNPSSAAFIKFKLLISKCQWCNGDFLLADVVGVKGSVYLFFFLVIFNYRVNCCSLAMIESETW